MPYNLKFITIFSLIFLLGQLQGMATLLEINAQNDIVSHGFKVRLSFDGVSDGPKDKFCVNAGEPRVNKNWDGTRFEVGDNWISFEAYDEHQRDVDEKKTVINAWGTISYVKRLVDKDFDKDLNKLFDERPEVVKRWRDQNPVKLYALDYSKYNNAGFRPDSTGGAIHLFPLVRKGSTNRIIGFSANDFDTVAHETGHNISHLLRPSNDFSRPQTGAIDESFGDFMAISSALSLRQVRNRFLQETGGNLGRSSFLSEVSESLSDSIGLGVHGIRNARNDLTFKNVDCEVHSLSNVLTGTFYDALIAAFDEECPRPWFFNTDERDRQGLKKINTDLRQVILATHAFIPYLDPSFSDYGHTMHKIASNNSSVTYLKKHILQAFEGREIDITAEHNKFSFCDKNAYNKHGKGGFKDNYICGTL